MKCQILFIGKNKKNISKCRLLKILPRVLSVKILTNRQLTTSLVLNNWAQFSVYVCVCVCYDISYKKCV